jgi:purine-binding chemotaxis protein CheW
MSPPPILGLFPHRREVIPIVSVVAEPVRDESMGSVGLATAPDSSFLILRTSQGLWGIAIDRVKTTVCSEHPVPRGTSAVPEPTGLVIVGSVERDGERHDLVDPEATWRGIRALVERWYVDTPVSAFIGATRREAGSVCTA